MKFRFVDRIMSWKPFERISGIKTVSFEEYNLKQPFGDQGRMPETLLLESLLQLGNWLILLSTDFKELGLIVRIAQINYLEPLCPGSSLKMEVTLARFREDGYLLSGEGKLDGRVVMHGRGCLAMPVPASEYIDVDATRVLFSEIHQPETI